MTDIEIPWANQRGRVYRFFEMLPAIISFSMFAAPVILSIVNPTAAAYFLIVYVLIWVFKSIAMSVRVLQGHKKIKQTKQLDWVQLLDDLTAPQKALKRISTPINSLHESHQRNLRRLAGAGELDMKPSEIIHAVIIATYNEPPEIIDPTIEFILAGNGVNAVNTAFFLAYEQAGGKQKKIDSLAAVAKHKNSFLHAQAVEHVLADDEMQGKGANATYCGEQIKKWAKANGIDPSRVLVTVLDADNRPDSNYFAALTYTYLIAPDRKHKSYQPVAVYINNIWDVPAIMRLSAVSNTYFHTANAMRLHALRNFSAHAQSLDALIETKFWSMRTIVEDGHQFWRAYFAFDGNHEVLPIYTPIYQDAVYAGGYFKSIVAQFKQIRRWTYGASDVAYVATMALKNPNIPKLDVIPKFGRLLESHVGWATSAPLLLLSGWIPLVVASRSSDDIVVQQLPKIIGRINTTALLLLVITMYIGMATLPTRPDHHSRKRYFAFLWQWLFTPLVGIVFNSFASISTQTRLFFGKYIESFVVTEKVVKKRD